MDPGISASLLEIVGLEGTWKDSCDSPRRDSVKLLETLLLDLEAFLVFFFFSLLAALLFFVTLTVGTVSSSAA